MAEAEGLQAVASFRRAQGAKRRPAARRAFVVARQRSRWLAEYSLVSFTPSHDGTIMLPYVEAASDAAANNDGK